MPPNLDILSETVTDSRAAPSATPQMRALQKLLVVPLGPLPELARTDALHLAIAAVSGCNFLLTWNFTHLINPQIRRMTDNIIRI